MGRFSVLCFVETLRRAIPWAPGLTLRMKDALKTKIGVDFWPYTILGACNPMLAHEPLKLEDKVDAVLPCNVVVQAKGNDATEIAAIDPLLRCRPSTIPLLRMPLPRCRSGSGRSSAS